MNIKYRIIIILRYANALDYERGLLLNEIERYIGKSGELVKEAVKELENEEKIYFDGEKVWLSYKGFLLSQKNYS
ncbi:MAG: hypothetical protein N3F64_00170 [Nitrososphaeria archaeon]|nr:hypothetical protein [Nitrososphaeria archaeon]